MKPKVKLSGTNGNVFALLGLCMKALKRAGQPEKAKELGKEVQSCGSYDEALRTMMGYVDVS